MNTKMTSRTITFDLKGTSPRASEQCFTLFASNCFIGLDNNILRVWLSECCFGGLDLEIREGVLVLQTLAVQASDKRLPATRVLVTLC